MASTSESLADIASTSQSLVDTASTSRLLPEMDTAPLEPDERADALPHPKHTVFLSHCGAQKNFVEQLYEDIKRRGQSPFFDQCTDSLPKGEVFADRIFEAAKRCAVAVVVLSSEFLESKWAMLELSTFVEAQKTVNPNLKLFPLFYQLEASAFKKASTTEMPTWTKMAAADARIDLDVWKNAVRVLARANGEVFSKYGGSEVRYRKAIVDAVCKLCRPYVQSRVPTMVGKDQICNIMEKEFEKLATESSGVGARILGLYGRGGMGKTFICKALCDHFSDEYSERVCYVEYSDGEYLQLLKLILEELTDIDEKSLRKIRTEEEANNSLERFLPKQDVFLALDNIQDDNVSWPLLRYLSAKSKVVVASRSLANIQRVVGTQAFGPLPCPTLTMPDALKLFIQSAGCTQPLAKWTCSNEEIEILKSLAKWTNKEIEILEECVSFSFLENNFNSSSNHSHSSDWLRGLHNSLELPEAVETDKEIEDLKKCKGLSLSENDSDLPLKNHESSTKCGHPNPVLLVAMGASIKEDYALQPKQLMKKCELVKLVQKSKRRRPLSEVLRTSHDALTGEEKLLFLDVVLFYPIMYLIDLEFIDILDRALKWMEAVDGSPRRDILNKLEKLKDFNRASNGDHSTVHPLLKNIYMVLAAEAEHRRASGIDEGLVQFYNKMIDTFSLLDKSPETKLSEEEKGLAYMFRGYERLVLKDFKGSLEDLDKADTLLPNHARILELRGTAKFTLRKEREALEDLNRAISLYSTTEVGITFAKQGFYVDAFATRALTKLLLKDLAGAKMDIDLACALNPDNYTAQLYRGTIYTELASSWSSDLLQSA